MFDAYVKKQLGEHSNFITSRSPISFEYLSKSQTTDKISCARSVQYDDISFFDKRIVAQSRDRSSVV